MATTSSTTTTTTAAPDETSTAAPEETSSTTTSAAETSSTTTAAAESSSTTTAAAESSSTTTAAAGAEPSVDEVTYTIDPDDGAEHNPHSVQISTAAKLTITWSTQNATSVRIDPLPGPFDASGSTDLESKDASYTIVALGDGGAESRPYALEVHTHDPSEVVSSHTDVTSGVAKVLSFTASTGESAAAGASVELSIVVSVDAESVKAADQDVELQDSGDGHKIGTVTVTIPEEASVTYTCEAVKDGATADTASLTLEITGSTTTTIAPSTTTTAPSSSTTAPTSTTTAASSTTTTMAPTTTTTEAPWDHEDDFSVIILDASGNPQAGGNGDGATGQN